MIRSQGIGWEVELSPLLMSRLGGIAVFTLVIMAIAVSSLHRSAATDIWDDHHIAADIVFHGREHPPADVSQDHDGDLAHNLGTNDQDPFHLTEHNSQAVCTCESNRLLAGWCTACDMGYVAGMIIESVKLFHVIDAHGHQINPSSIKCQSCRAALQSDGYCTASRWGFVDEMMYATELTWSLARGRVIDPTELDCQSCRNATFGQGWCQACVAGQVGAVRFDDRNKYDRAAAQQSRLDEAIETLARCEECALRTFTGGVCRQCGTSWE